MCIINNDTFVGCLESDGFLSSQLQVLKAKGDGHKISITPLLIIDQSNPNRDILIEIQNFLGGGKIKETKGDKNKNELDGGRLTVNLNSPEGKKALEILETNPPRLKRVARDLELTKQIIAIKEKARIFTPEQKAKMILLTYQFSSQIKESTVIKKTPIEEVIRLLKLEAFIKETSKIIETKYLPKINAVEESTVVNLNKEFSNDYLRGFFIGDGEIAIPYSFRGKTVGHSFKFSIADPDLLFLGAIKRQLGCGEIEGIQYRIQDKKIIAKVIFPILESGFLPAGRAKAFLKFKEAYTLSFQPTSPDFWTEFVNLTYDLNRDGARRHKTKEKVIKLGRDFYKNG